MIKKFAIGVVLCISAIGYIWFVFVSLEAREDERLEALRNTGHMAFVHAVCAGEKLCSFKVVASDDYLDSDKPVLKFTVVNGRVFDEDGYTASLPDSCLGLGQAGHIYHCEVTKIPPAT